MIDLNEGFHLDFETHSDINLVKVGPFVYTENWSTDVWCCGYALGEGEVKLWRPGMDIPAEYLQAYYTGRPFIAHNAGFERAVIQNIMLARYGWPMPPLNQWVCTAAMAAAMALPRALDGACKVMNLDQQKDEGGHDLMMRMARPRSRTHIPCIVCGLMACDHHDMFKTVLTWWDDEERRQRLGAYCMQDVRAERALTKVLRPLSAHERLVWMHNEVVNERGVAVDLKFVRAAWHIVKALSAELNEEIRVATNNFVSATTQASKLRVFMAMWGEPLESLRKTYLADVLNSRIDLAPMFRALLELRLEGSKSSTAKLTALILRSCGDGRARDNLMFHGAGTGRVSGRGFQPQNLPRPIIAMLPYVDECLEMVRNGCSLEEFKEALLRWQTDQNQKAENSQGKIKPILFRGLDMISVCLRPCLIAARSID